MLRLDELGRAVDLYRGSVRFCVPLGSLPGLNGPDYSLLLTYDSAAVDETVADWNLSRPTGVAGLGWTLERDRISLDCGDPLGSDEALASPSVTLRLGGRDYTLVPAGAGAYAVVPHRFWQVGYAPAAQTWTVVLEDGTRLVFGDLASGRATVDWGYAWGDWKGASANAAGRARVAVAWSLSQVIDVWGNAFTFSYGQVEAGLGDPAAPYTRATYLERVDGPLGGHLTLAYVEKTPPEWQNPFGGPGEAAWQARFETRALASVEEAAAGGAVVAVTALDYTSPSGGLATIGSGDRTKRLLMGLSRRAPGAYDLPGPRFTYDVDPASPSYGALLTVTTPAGGVARFAYQRPALALPRRDRAVSPPVKAGVAYTDPRLSFGRDYAVALWRGSDGTAAATAYRWEGRWLSAAVAAPTAPDAAAYGRLRVVTGDRCFALVGDSDYTLFHADPCLPGGWVGSQSPEPFGLPAGEPVAAAAGAGYVALLAARSGALVFRWFDGAAWRALACPAPQGTQLAALDGAPQVLARISSTGAGASHDLLLVHPDPATGWAASAYTVECDVPGLDGLALTAGATYAVAALAHPAGADRAAAYCALRWSQDFATVDTAPLQQAVATPPAALPAVQLRGATVLIGQDAYRFDGAAWRHQDLSKLVHPRQSGVGGLSLGADTVVRAVTLDDGSVLYDLIAYNPADASGAPWSYAPGLGGLPAKAGTATTAMAARFGPGDPGAASRFALLNNGLYLRGGDGAWPQVLDITATFDPGTIPGLLLFAGDYLVYQAGGGVTAYPLRGGGLAAPAGITLAGAKLLLDGGRALAGETAFAAYTGEWGQPGCALTLYRPVAAAVSGALAPLTVRSVTLYGSGVPAGATGQAGGVPEAAAGPAYDAVPCAYAFDAATATVSPCGRLLQANRATAVPGSADPGQGADGRAETFFFNLLSPGEPPALPYPTGDGLTNAAAYLGVLGGLRYAQRTLAQGSADPDSAEAYWWWTTAVPVGGRFLATYSRRRQEEEAVKGVPLRLATAYAPETGLAQRVAVTGPDGRRLEVAFTYWWEKYDPGRALNLLTPVVQTLEYAGGVLTRGTVNTWRGDWVAGGTHWAPRATWVALKPDPAPWTAWTGDPSPLPDGWMLAEDISARTAAGTVLATGDALGCLGSSLTSADGRLPVASFANASAAGQEAGYYGLEPYESPGPWQYAGGRLEDHIVAAAAHLGTRCLEITPDAAARTGPTATWVPAGQDRAYLFSCWARTNAGFGPPSPQAQWEITLRTAGASPQPLGDPITLPLPSTAGEWQYLSAVIPLGARRREHGVPPGTPAQITALGYDQKPGQPAYVDDLRFQPLDAAFYAVALDPASGAALGALGQNGATTRLIRDANGFVTAVVGPEDTRARLAILAHARLMSPGGAYQDALPNMLLEASTGAAAVYEDFRASHAGRWTLPAGWTLAGGRLTFAGTAPPPRGSCAALNGFQRSDYAASVRFVPPAAGPLPNVGMGCGNVLAYHDSQAQTWVLTCNDGGTWRDLASRPGALAACDLTFAVLEGRITFFAAGQQVFSLVLPASVTADGTLGLYLTGGGSFEALVALPEPELRLAMIDGRGLARQSITLLDGAQVAARGVVLDALGRPAYQKNPVAVPVFEVDARIGGGTAAYLPSAGGQPQSLEHYLAYGHGSPFEREAFVPSPLVCPQETGQPGDTLAIGGGHSTALALAPNAAGGPMAGLVPDAQAANYHLATLVDPDGTSVYALVSPLGPTIAQRVALGTGETLTYAYEYDAAGRLVAVRPPNAFSGAAGAPDDWKTRCSRDFLGRVTAVTTPDSQTTQFAYDSRGRLRFQLDPAGAALTPPRLVYYKYDGLDRPVEAGTIQNAAVTWAAAQAQVDNPAWPGADLAPAICRALAYDAPAGDGPGAAATFVEGRLWQARTAKAGGALGVGETFGYDPCGDVIQHWTEAPDYDAAVRVTSLAYDGRGRPVRVDYPRPVTQPTPPFSVAYTYDRLGRLIAAGEPGGAADRYLRLQYNPDDTPSAISCGQGAGGTPTLVSYTYSAAGWPVQISSPVYSEALGYTGDGYAGAAYYGAQVAWVRRTWRPSPGALCPLRDYTSRLAFDPAGRLIAATPYLGADDGAPAGEPPVRYDPSGNLLQVRRDQSSDGYQYSAPAPAPAGPTRAVAPAPAGALAAPGTVPSDRPQSVAGALAAYCDFESQPPPGWSWGATNAGPGGAAVADGGPQGSTKCLNLPGGTPGAANCLEYRGYVDPRGQYTVNYWIKADAAFAAQPGFAGWCVSLHGPGGPAVTVPVGPLADVPTTWTQRSLAVDMQALFTGRGLWAPVVEASFLLINDKRAQGPNFGAAVQVDNVAISGSGAGGALAYDALGRVTGLLNAGLSDLAYSPDSRALVALTTAAEGGFTLAWALDQCGRPAARTATPSSGGDPQKALVLRSPGGLALAQLDSVGGVERRRYFVAGGPQGTLAVQDDGRMCYVLRGHDGSIQATVDEQGSLVAHTDTDAFGRVQGTAGPVAIPTESPDPLTGLLGDRVVALGTKLEPDRAATTNLEPSPPGEYTDDLTAGRFQVDSPDWWNAIGSMYGADFASKLRRIRDQDAPKWKDHNRAGWEGSGVTEAEVWRRFFKYKRIAAQCRAAGLLGIVEHPLAEDMFHLAEYPATPDEIGGRRLRPRFEAPIPQGYYIFVVTEPGEFLYRDMCDRKEGYELYVRHSQLNSGGCAVSAGMFHLHDDQVDLTGQSGHYQPEVERVQQAAEALKGAGYANIRVYPRWWEFDLKREMNRLNWCRR